MRCIYSKKDDDFHIILLTYITLSIYSIFLSRFFVFLFIPLLGRYFTFHWGFDLQKKKKKKKKI